MTVVPLHRAEPGWLYVLRDPFRPGYCKVGKTTRDPHTRAAELSTGAPYGLEVVAAWQVEDVTSAERDAHAVLAAHRVDAGNEWFRVSAAQAAASLAPSDVDPPTTSRRRWHRTRLAVEFFGWFTLGLMILGAALGS